MSKCFKILSSLAHAVSLYLSNFCLCAVYFVGRRIVRGMDKKEIGLYPRIGRLRKKCCFASG